MSDMASHMHVIAERVLSGVDNELQITTYVFPEVEVGDWFRVALVARRDDETVTTLVRVDRTDVAAIERAAALREVAEKVRGITFGRELSDDVPNGVTAFEFRRAVLRDIAEKIEAIPHPCHDACVGDIHADCQCAAWVRQEAAAILTEATGASE